MTPPAPRRRARLPRPVHPGAWWTWAIGCAAAASATTNPLLLLLLLAAVGNVVVARRTAAPWARAFVVFLRIALVVLLIRTVFQVVLGSWSGGTVLVTLPELALPAWAAGIRLGGPVTAEALVAATTDGLRLAAVLVCIGAANALANPKRLLASLPAALHELGVAVTVAISFAPQMVASVRRIRAARRLRGRPDRGVRSLVQVAVPVLEDALDRALSLAAAMDARGYGRQADVPVRTRRVTGGLLLVGMLGVALGLFGLLGAGPRAALPAAGPVLGGGVLLAVVGMRLAGRRTVRSRYRPDPWATPEWATLGSGTAAAAAVLATAGLDPAAVAVPLDPLAVPTLHPLATVGVLTAALPAVLTPPPTRFGTGKGPRRLPPATTSATHGPTGPPATSATTSETASAADPADPSAGRPAVHRQGVGR